MPGFETLSGMKSNLTLGWNTGKFSTLDTTQKKVADENGDASSPESLPEPERPPLRYIDQYIAPECPCLSKRLTVAVFACLGFIVMFGMRCNFGVAKLELQEITNITLKEFDSSIFYGYLLTQVPAGFLATQYPANLLFGAAIGTSSFLNLFVPGTLINSPFIVMCIRITQGLVEGFTYPSCHGIWRYWAPPLERSKLATLAFCGCYAGVMLGFPIGGILVKHIGWQSPFYFYGFVGICWCLAWNWLVFEKPSLHPTIEARELLYIENSLGKSGQTSTVMTIADIPWKDFFTSPPVWAIFIANFCRSWNFYLLVLFQTSFVSDVYAIGIEKNAVLGAIPHLLMTIIVPTGGILADYIRKKGILTTTQVRKLFNCGGFGLEATFFLVVAFSDSYSEAITALTVGVAFSGFAISGFNVNHLDIAPKYASILMGLSNAIGTIAGVICPHVVHRITDYSTERPKENWKEVFILAATVHFIGVAFYAVFASGELQPWADPKLLEEKQWNPMNENIQVKKSPSEQSNGLLQRQPSGKNLNYGTIESTGPTSVVTTSNPFISGTNPFREESVQPQAQDSYLHGGIDDRTY